MGDGQPMDNGPVGLHQTRGVLSLGPVDADQQHGAHLLRDVRAPMDATSLIYQRSGRIVLTGRRPSAVPPGAAVFLELSWSQGGKLSPGRARPEHRLALRFGGYCYQGGARLRRWQEG